MTNYKIDSQIPCQLASSLKIEATEKLLYNFWQSYISEPEKITTDATCYESEVRYPTDQKILWESVHWLYRQLKAFCKSLKVKLPRTKYIKWSRRYIGYGKMRRKTNKRRISITRAFLKLLHTLLFELTTLQAVLIRTS